MRLVDNWHKKLTHGYCAWSLYASIAVEYVITNFSLVSDYLPEGTGFVLIPIGLTLSLIKQESVSGPAAPAEPAQ